MKTRLNHKLIDSWLSERGLKINKGFADALSEYAKVYKKHNCKSVDEVYFLLGINRHRIYHWRNSFTTSPSSVNLKRSVVKAAGEIFGLENKEIELLANKAGLSVFSDYSFTDEFKYIILNFEESNRRLCEISIVSERMFRHIKNGKHLKKESLLSLAISAGADIEKIQSLLKSAGYTLSTSLPGDMVVMWMLLNNKQCLQNRVLQINEVLHNLGLPILMTSERSRL